MNNSELLEEISKCNRAITWGDPLLCADGKTRFGVSLMTYRNRLSAKANDHLTGITKEDIPTDKATIRKMKYD